MTIPVSTGPFRVSYTVGSHHSRRSYVFYFFLRCLKEHPANVFVVLLVFLLFKALLATLPTRFDVLGAAMIIVCLSLVAREGIEPPT
jgi:drug/metabolite transporter (DMT)-like permease